MRRLSAITILFTFAIISINIDSGSLEEASSYSNHFRGSHQGYHYPQKYKKFESRSNEIVAEDAFHKLFNEIKTQQKLKTATSYNNRDIFINRNKTRDEESQLEFSYNENDRYGPPRWKDINAQCGGRNQSPIAIDTGFVAVRENAQELIIDGVDLVPQSMKVENNGHSLKLSFKYQNDQKINISGGPLKNPFILDNIHFHWGSNTSGSEHVINDQRYAAELHMVTYNSIFETFEMASQDPMGLAVLGILYEYDKLYTGKDNPWVKFITKVIKAHSTYTETKWVFPIRDIIKDVDFRGLLSYRGSLTTPNCSENVLWMLSTRPIVIKQNELVELRKLRNGKGRRIIHNYRPLQDTNGRTVTAYKYK
ncbi:hypothetical protein ACKWTF_012536 [Chironomus riparius]